MQTKENKQEEIYNLYYNKVFGYVMNRVQNRANAEDITSEIFLKLISKSEEFDLKKPGASTYIFRVMLKNKPSIFSASTGSCEMRTERRFSLAILPSSIIKYCAAP